MRLVPQHWPLTHGEGRRRCRVSLTSKKQKLCEVAQGGPAQEHVRSQSPTIRSGPPGSVPSGHPGQAGILHGPVFRTSAPALPAQPRPQQETASTPCTSQHP